jgi:phosphoribosylaminoimidazole carboxylase PurE protein
MKKTAPSVGILMGSDSDWPVVEGAARTLDEFDVRYEVRVLSAHRTPDEAAEYARSAARRGLRVLIAAAGGAAHLAGALAANTVLPVIGIPVAGGSLGGLDALLSTVQMPGGIPVATVAIGPAGAVNAAVLAAQILAQSRADLGRRLLRHRAALRRKVRRGDARVQSEMKRRK